MSLSNHRISFRTNFAKFVQGFFNISESGTYKVFTIFRPHKSNQGSNVFVFCRDSLCYMVAIAALFISLDDGQITWVESLVMIFMYFLYITLMKVIILYYL